MLSFCWILGSLRTVILYVPILETLLQILLQELFIVVSNMTDENDSGGS